MPPTLDSSLVDLLGEARAQVVEALRAAPATAPDLAGRLGLSEPAARRHLQALERDGLVETSTLRRAGPGRPGTRYALSARARRLYPDRSADVANEVLTYLETEQGRPALLSFLRWRQARQAERYSSALDGVADPRARVDRLADLLSEDGFLAESAATTAPDGATVLTLVQGHCAVASVAAEHPELCAYEAALFQRVVGGRLSRRETIAGGASSCVCTITPSTDKGAPHVHQG